MHIIRELRKRRVLTTAAIYVPVAWVTTEVLTFLFEKFPVPAWSEELVAAAFVAGFPATIVLAWTFDLGPDGLTRTTASRAQGWLAIVCAALLMAGGTIGLFKLIETPVEAGSKAALEVSTAPVNSIAVYPFENLSSDPENAYFSEGMTSELIARLSQIRGLKIAAISQTRQQTLAQGLEPLVQYRLEGTVRKSGDRVRITALLVDSSSGFSAWSEEFDGRLQDVFALQDQTALRIAQALDVRLSPQEESALSRRDTNNPEAYDAFLRGWSLIESFHAGAAGAPGPKLAAARADFQQALRIDPDYARALAGLAMAENYSVLLQLEPPAELGLARKFAEQALALGGDLPETHFAMAGVLANSKDFDGSVAAYRRTLKLDPQNGFAWCELSSVLNVMDPVAAEIAAREAIHLRPAYATAYFTLGAALDKQQRWRDAIEAYQQSLLLSPGSIGLQETIGQLLFKLGDYAESLAYLEKLEPTPALQQQINAARQALGSEEAAP